MKKKDIITEINGVKFYYGGYNENGWHLVYTDDENFHVGKERSVLPEVKDCQRIYRNYYL